MNKKNIFRDLVPEQLLFAEGEEGWEMFIVISGAIEVFLLRDGLQVTLAELGPGHFLGEMSLLEGEPRSANAVALAPTRLLVINHDNFQQFICQNTSLAVKMMKGLSGRLRIGNEKITRLEAELQQHGQQSDQADSKREGKRPAGSCVGLSADELAWRRQKSLQAAVTHQLDCPVCYNNFKALILQREQLKKHTRDFWLRDRYEGVEPLLLRHICCTRCYLAAPVENFLEIGQLYKERLKREERMRRSKVTIPEQTELDYALAINYYRLALLCLENNKEGLSLRSRLALELSWLCRETGREAEEKEALEQAKTCLEGMVDDTEAEAGAGRQKDLYLLGLIALRLGDEPRGRHLLEQTLAAGEQKRNVVQLLARQVLDCLENKQPLPC